MTYSIENLRQRLRGTTLTLGLLGLLAACGGSDTSSGSSGLPGQPGTAALVRSSIEPASANCAAGGTRVDSGLDTNTNGVLDDGEVKATAIACNGLAGAVGTPPAASMPRTSAESVGANCTAGGVRIQTGLDSNSDGQLQDAEVQLSHFTCHGASSQTGPAGAAGEGGAGTPGAESPTRLIFTTAAPDIVMTGGGPGFGGLTRFIFTTSAPLKADIVMTGGGDGIASLIRTTPEPAGANCAAGGLRVQVGLDTNRDGVLQASEVTSTDYVCSVAPAAPKAWQTAQLVGTSNAGTAVDPQIAVDANGNAMAVWTQREQRFSGVFNIWANRFTPAGGWGAATLIETDNAGDAFAPQIAVGANGNAMAVWQQSDGTRTNIWANRFTLSAGGGSWGKATLIESNDAGNADKPQIAVDVNGNAMAIWRQNDGTNTNILGNRFTPARGGGSWGATTLVGSASAGDADTPQIAFDANGNAMAVWTQVDLTSYYFSDMWASRFTASAGGGSWGTATLIAPNNMGNAINPQIAIDVNGNALVVWVQFYGFSRDIWSNRFSSAGGSWGTATLIETANTGNALEPQIAVDATGNALAVWTQSDGTRYNIWANRFTVAAGGGGSWGAATLIQSDTVRDAGEPQIAFDSSGNAMAVWAQSDGLRDTIWASRFAAAYGGSWGAPSLIESNITAPAKTPQIALDTNGNAMAIWAQSDRMRDNIWANRFR